MPSIGRPSGTRPAWYRRLPPSLQRVAEQSDRVSSLPLRAGPALADAVLLLPDALRSEDTARGEAVAQRIADGVCGALGGTPLAHARLPAGPRGLLRSLEQAHNRSPLDRPSRAAGWQPEASYPFGAYVCQARLSQGSQ